MNLAKFIKDVADSTRLTIETATKIVGSVIGKLPGKGKWIGVKTTSGEKHKF